MSHDERDLLVRELRDRSRDVGGHPIDLDDVRASAHRIRWRRRAVAGAVAAVVVAVAVPVGLGVTGTLTTGNPPIANRTTSPPSPSPAPEHSPSPSTTPDRSPTPAVDGASIPLDPSAAAQGPAPRVDYLQGATLHRTDGSTVQLPGRYVAFTPYHGGWLAASFKQGDGAVVELDGSLHQVSSRPGDVAFAVSQDVFNPAWFVGGGAGEPGHLLAGIASGMGNGEADQPVPAGAQVHPIGWLRGGVLYERYLNRNEVLVTDLNGHNRKIPGALAASGTSEADGLAALQTSSTSTGSCWRVQKVDGARPGPVLWHTCDFALGKFSQDGKYLVGTEAYGDGLGGKLVAILDAHTGKPVAVFELPAQSADFIASPAAWEGEDTLLVQVHSGDGWRMLRLGADGTVQRVLGPLPGAGEVTPPWVLAARP